jgi:hypothetical protein
VIAAASVVRAQLNKMQQRVVTAHAIIICILEFRAETLLDFIEFLYGFGRSVGGRGR